MADLYRICRWDETYENNRSREYKRLTWVPIPNRHDGASYAELLDHKNGAGHFGAWIACVQVASRCAPRGSLLRDSGRPHTALSLSLVTRIPERTFTEALPRFESLGWLERIPCEGNGLQQPCGIPAGNCEKTAEPCLEQNRTELNRTEKKRTSAADAGRPVFDLWNQHRGEMRLARRDSLERLQKCAALLKDCHGDLGIVEAMVRALAADPFHRERRTEIDTFLRPSHRAKYIDNGLEWLDKQKAQARPRCDLDTKAKPGESRWETFYRLKGERG